MASHLITARLMFYQPLFVQEQLKRTICSSCVDKHTRNYQAFEKRARRFLAEPPRQRTPTGGRGVSKAGIISEPGCFPNIWSVYPSVPCIQALGVASGYPNRRKMSRSSGRSHSSTRAAVCFLTALFKSPATPQSTPGRLADRLRHVFDGE